MVSHAAAATQYGDHAETMRTRKQEGDAAKSKPAKPAGSSLNGSTLKAADLVKKYKKRTVVNEVAINVRQGEIVGLLGPNGAGKTTTFYMIVGMVRPNGGRVTIDANEMTTMPMYHRARMGIGYLPQEASIFRRLSVRDNILAVLEMSGLSRLEQGERCEQLLNDFGLAHIA